MIRWIRRQLGLSRQSGLDPRRLRVDRALSALPASVTADALGELLARGNADLGERAGQIMERLGRLATQVGEEAANLSESDAAAQIRGLATRAAGRTAQLASLSGVERMFAPPPPPRRRGSDVGLLLLAAGAGFAVGGGLILLLTQRRKAAPQPPAAGRGPAHGVAPGETGSEPEMDATADAEAAPGAQVSAALDRTFSSLRGRIEAAKNEARRTREQVERRLWRQYRRETAD
jgi:hypothetical protein